MKLYVAEPMDHAYSRVANSNMVAAVTDDLRRLWKSGTGGQELEVFRPREFWETRKSAPVSSRMTRNTAEIRSSDLVLAFLDGNILSIGVPMEILLAHQDGKPVIVCWLASRFDSAMLKFMPDLIETASAAGAIKETMTAMTAIRTRTGRPGSMLALRTDGSDGPAFADRPYAGDCGLDLAITEDVLMHAGESADVPTGVAVALPRGTFGLITGRSSTWSKHGLIVMQGIIDEGWRGELRVMLYYPLRLNDTYQLSKAGTMIKRGTRLAQLIVLPNLVAGLDIRTVTRLPEGDRGEAGFGSSGE